MHGRMDGWMHAWRDGWMHPCMQAYGIRKRAIRFCMEKPYMRMEAPKGSLRLASFGASFSVNDFGFGEPLGFIDLGFEGTQTLGKTR